MASQKKPNILDNISALPASLLKSAYLVGKTPFWTSHFDPRVSFSLYIPPTAYCPVHDALRDGTPPSKLRRLPVIVNLHGVRRDASLMRDSLTPFADQHGVAILAPLFPAGLDGPTDLDNYKDLRSATCAADRVLLSLLDQVAAIWPGLRCERVTLLGWSGGAQFAHRFAYFHAARLEALIVASPGRTTLADEAAVWPAGTRIDVAATPPLEGLKTDMDALRAVPHVFMAVGAEDGFPEGAQELRAILAKVQPGKEKALVGLKARYDYLQELSENWRANGIKVEFELVPGVAHTYLEVLPVILRWLEKCPIVVKADEQQWRQGGSVADNMAMHRISH